MPLVAGIRSDFLICPPLDYPLRLAHDDDVGHFGAPRLIEQPGGDCCSDHFASVTPDGSAGRHHLHEAVDLASGAGSCVYAAYSGTIVDIEPGRNLTIDHQGQGEAYASKYLHVTPGPKAIGQRVLKGEIIASVNPHVSGDHLHFELWHWITPNPQGDTDAAAVPVDPTRLLYYWEQALGLDFAVLGTISSAAHAELDFETPGAALSTAYDLAGISLPSSLEVTSLEVTALAPGCAWEITGGDVVHLLRRERGAITVIDSARGYRTISASSIEHIGITRRMSYPTFLVEANGITYGVPLHQASESDQTLVELIRNAFADRNHVELEIRRSAFWRMDGSLDEIAGVVAGIRLG